MEMAAGLCREGWRHREKGIRNKKNRKRQDNSSPEGWRGPVFHVSYWYHLL